jgi:hypothetical protein
MHYPFKFIKIGSAVVAFCLLFTQPTLAFSDVKNHWANACVSQLQSRLLVSGYPDGRFQPNSTLTRAEFAVLMLNAFPNATIQRRAIAFKDVPTNHWAYKAIRDAYQRGFFAGYPDGTFQPSQPIPRVQALGVLTNATSPIIPEQSQAILQQSFNDYQQIPNYAKGAIAAATNERFVVNYPNVRQLNPNQSTTRGEVAAFLCQSLNWMGTVPAEYIAGDKKLFAIEPERGGIGDFQNGLALAIANEKYGYIDTSGKLVIPAQYDDARHFADGLAAVQIGGKWGYINPKGERVIPPQFTMFADFTEGLAKVTQDNQVGFIDKTGKLVIPYRFDEAYSFSEGVAIVRVGQQWSYIDKTGQLLIPLQPHPLQSFSNGMAAIKVNNQYGFIDKTGKRVIEPQFLGVDSFYEELAAVMIPNTYQWGYIDKTGKVIIEAKFSQAQRFSEGLAGVKMDDKWGFIDKKGAVVIPYQFFAPQDFPGDGVEPFSGSLAMVRLGEKAGFINKIGNMVIQPQFGDAWSFSEGFARVSISGKWVREVNIGGSNSPPEISVWFEDGKWGYIRNPVR